MKTSTKLSLFLPFLALSSVGLSSCAKDDIESLSNRVSSLEDKVDDLQSQIDELKQQIEDLASEMSTAIAGIRTDYESKISALEDEVLKAKQNISSLTTQYEKDKKALEDDVDGTEEKINELTSAYNAKVSEIESAITSINNTIESLKTEMNNKIQEVRDDYTNKISALSSRVSALENVTYHTVTFDSNGGTEVNSQSIAHGEKASKPTAPKRTGYTFEGWFVDDAEWVFVGYSVTSNITLTAKWTINSYTLTVVSAYDDIKFTCDPGLTTPYGSYTIKLKYNTEVTCKVSSVDEGYEFSAWYGNGVFLSTNQTLTFRMPAKDYRVEAYSERE